MKANHTPGPWKYTRDKDDGRYVPHAHVWGPAVTVSAGGNLDLCEPDMLLIAAAPELLDALRVAELFVAQFEDDDDYTEGQVETINTVRAAIAKATGETPCN